jgi:hypothetical protein
METALQPVAREEWRVFVSHEGAKASKVIAFRISFARSPAPEAGAAGFGFLAAVIFVRTRPARRLGV